MPDEGWEHGDLLGVDFPVHLDALRAAGPDLLTRAFRAAGSIGPDVAVASVDRLEPFSGGSTGRKAMLSVTYEGPDADLASDLFVKFSRDLDDERRDRGRRQMASEVRFGLLSQIPDFPVAVPRCMFGEYHDASGSGILVSERIRFGADGVEPHHPKALDHELDDPLGHYEALLSAVARLAGEHRAGRFPEDVMARFRRDPPRARRATRSASDAADEIRERVDRYADFAASCPQLLPASLRTPGFLAELRDQAPRSVEHADALRAVVRDAADELQAFTHWNANIDNAWFWRDDAGALACGLFDWGNVGEVHLVTAIASCLTFAEPAMVVEQLDHLLALFSSEFEGAGGGPLDPALLREQFAVHVVSGGLRWPLGAVPLLEQHVPDLASTADRFDPRIADDELARTQLHLLTTYLTLWQHADARGLLDRVLGRS